MLLQELKGNIRVFCRVRPVLPDNDSSGTDGAVVSYPTSMETAGRGIDLMHSSMDMFLYQCFKILYLDYACCFITIASIMRH